MSTSTSSMSDLDGRSYFTAPRRGSSGPDSPDISPHTSTGISQRSGRKRPPLRPHSHAQAYSDELPGYSRSKVQTIEEDALAGTEGVPLAAPRHPLRLGSKEQPEEHVPRGAGSVRGSHHSSSRASGKPSMSFTQKFFSSAENPEEEVIPNSPKKAGRDKDGARSEPGPRPEKLKFTLSMPKRMVRSAENLRRGFSTSDSNDSQQSPATVKVIALRPPVSKIVINLEPSYQHAINLETPFTVPPEPQTEAAVIAPTTSRRSSLRAKDMITAPMNFIRKIRKASLTPTLPRHRGSSSHSELHNVILRGHTTQLRRKRTHEALRHVTSLLRNIAGDQPGNLTRESSLQPLQVRSMSAKSTWPGPSAPSEAAVSRDARMSYGLARDTGSLGRLRQQKSMELKSPGSPSSSVRRIRMGVTPNATPDELATYKIKRCPSAETEKFLKVDISIRGGTSYLREFLRKFAYRFPAFDDEAASEARRIHTPPSPGEDYAGRRRGFFFDYNAPPTPQPGKDYYIEAGELLMNTKLPCGIEVSDKKTHPRLRSGHPKTVEWYDLALADLNLKDDVDEEPGQTMAREDAFLDVRQVLKNAQSCGKTQISKCSGNDWTIVQSKSDEVDETVPDHYPTSPLCPAHPKYWRFVDGKLKRGMFARVCWMHGPAAAWRLSEDGEG